MDLWVKNIPTHSYVSNGEKRFTAYCLCDGKFIDGGSFFNSVCYKYKWFDMMVYNGKRICVCKDCFKNKKNILKEQFKEKFDFKYNF